MTDSRARAPFPIASAPDDAVGIPVSSETWYVATASGTCGMTLDVLEAAFAKGEVDTTTPVWIPGMAGWEPLGSVANLEDGAPLDSSRGGILPDPLDATALIEGAVPLAEPARREAPEAGGGSLFARGLTAPDPSDPNHALWASVMPRGAEPVPRVQRAGGAVRERLPMNQMLVATIIVSLLLSSFTAWRWLVSAAAQAAAASVVATAAAGHATGRAR